MSFPMFNSGSRAIGQAYIPGIRIADRALGCLNTGVIVQEEPANRTNAQRFYAGTKRDRDRNS